jgi:serine carboxypeptidase-like clade 1
MELGPLILQEGGTGLIRNPYSWTTLAHLLVLESPAGVGFSYCHNMTRNVVGHEQQDEGGCINTDTSTARDARAALQDFFTSVFPSLRYNPVYIAGESYAGVYVPTLVKELLDHARHDLPNLKGFTVGDPCTDNESQQQSMDMIWYAHKYGMITHQTYQTLYHQCNLRIPPITSRGSHYGSREKNKLVAQAKRDNMIASSQKQHRYDIRRALLQEDRTDECELEYRRFLLQTSNGISQEFTDFYINPYALYEPVDGSYDDALVAYMNREDVQRALNVAQSPTKTWYAEIPDTDTTWEYHSEFAACNDDAIAGVPSMVEFYRYLAPRLERIVVFNGDADPCVSYEGTLKAMYKVGFPVVPGGDYRPWFYSASNVTSTFLKNKPLSFGSMLSVHDAGRQYGGHVVNFEHGLSFATVHGSGHMVPQIRPRPALHLLEHLLDGRILSPLYLPDDVIASMNETVFEDYVAHWTESAKHKI